METWAQQAPNLRFNMMGACIKSLFMTFLDQTSFSTYGAEPVQAIPDIKSTMLATLRQLGDNTSTEIGLTINGVDLSLEQIWFTYIGDNNSPALVDLTLTTAIPILYLP